MINNNPEIYVDLNPKIDKNNRIKVLKLKINPMTNFQLEHK